MWRFESSGLGHWWTSAAGGEVERLWGATCILTWSTYSR